MLSTGGMLKYAEQLEREASGSAGSATGREAVVATETGMLYPLRMAAPDVDVHPRQRRGQLRVHEDDHAAEAARRAARDAVRGPRPRGDRHAGRGSRSTAWSRSAESPRGAEARRLEFLGAVRADAGDRELVADPRGDLAHLVEGDVVERRDRRVGVDVLAEDDRSAGAA